MVSFFCIKIESFSRRLGSRFSNLSPLFLSFSLSLSNTHTLSLSHELELSPLSFSVHFIGPKWLRFHRSIFQTMMWREVLLKSQTENFFPNKVEPKSWISNSNRNKTEPMTNNSYKQENASFSLNQISL